MIRFNYPCFSVFACRKHANMAYHRNRPLAVLAIRNEQTQGSKKQSQ